MFAVNDILLSIDQIANHSYCLCHKASLQLYNLHSLQLYNLTGFTIGIEYCFILHTSNDSPNSFILRSLLLLVSVFDTVVFYSSLKNVKYLVFKSGGSNKCSSSLLYMCECLLCGFFCPLQY